MTPKKDEGRVLSSLKYVLKRPFHFADDTRNQRLVRCGVGFVAGLLVAGVVSVVPVMKSIERHNESVAQQKAQEVSNERKNAALALFRSSYSQLDDEYREAKKLMDQTDQKIVSADRANLGYYLSQTGSIIEQKLGQYKVAPEGEWELGKATESLKAHRDGLANRVRPLATAFKKYQQTVDKDRKAQKEQDEAEAKTGDSRNETISSLRDSMTQAQVREAERRERERSIRQAKARAEAKAQAKREAEKKAEAKARAEKEKKDRELREAEKKAEAERAKKESESQKADENKGDKTDSAPSPSPKTSRISSKGDSEEG